MSDTKVSALTAASLPLDATWQVALAKGTPDDLDRRAPAWALGAWYDWHEETVGATGVEFEFPDEPFAMQLLYSNVRAGTGTGHFGFDIWIRGAGAYSTDNLRSGIWRTDVDTAGTSASNGTVSSPVAKLHRWDITVTTANYPMAGVGLLHCVAATQPLIAHGESYDFEPFSGSYYPERSNWVVSNAQSNPAAINRIQKLRFRWTDSRSFTGWFGVRRLI